MLYGHSIEQFYLENPLLGYLIAIDVFPQSAVYLLPASNSSRSDVLIRAVGLLMIRFKPDNLMHVLHDDILPIHAVLQRMFPGVHPPFPVRLIFADGYGVMPHDELYQALVTHELTYGEVGDPTPICFEQVIVGFDRTTLWYQYGFSSAQGPLPYNSTLIKSLVKSYTKLIGKVSGGGDHITLFSRHETRLILNENALMRRLARHFSMSVKVVDLNTHSLAEVIEAVSASSLVIGMHGALLATIWWLPANSTVLELFPYAVTPTRYTPYRTLAEALGLRYLSWVNTDADSTVGHPDYPKEYGGLGHLSTSEKERIMADREVRPHLCCGDTSWLYHIYQDTVVNVDDIIHLLEQSETY